MKKLFLILLCIVSVPSEIFAYSPFDIVLRNPADIAVADVYQDLSSKDMYLKICNVGNDMQEAGDLLIGIRKANGITMTNTVNDVTMNAGTCRDFDVGSVSKLGVIGSEGSYFTAAAKLINTKTESNLVNNIISKYLTVSSVNITTPWNTQDTSNPWILQSPYPSYGGADFTVQNIRFERLVSAYRDGSITSLSNAFAGDICNYGDAINLYQSLQSTFTINNHTEYVTINPYYNIASTWRSGECRTVAIEASKFWIGYGMNNQYNVSLEANTGYNRVPESNTTNNILQTLVWTNGTNGNIGNSTIQVISPNGGETYSSSSNSQITVQGQLTYAYQNINRIDIEVYRRSNSNNGSETLYTTNHISNPCSTSSWNATCQISQNISIYSWPDDNYRIRLVAYGTDGNVFSDWSDSTFRVQNANGSPDLVVRSVYQQDSDKRIIAQICNEGASMNQSAYIRNDFSNSSNYQIVSKYTSIQLNTNECTTNSSVLPTDLGITSNGTYSVTVKADATDVVNETNQTNNSLTTSFYITTSNSAGVDLAVENIRQDAYSKNITARICNRGNDMYTSQSVSIDWSNSASYGGRSTQYQWLRLTSGQCIDTSISPSDIGIYSSGYYAIGVTVDSSNLIGDINRNNNSMNQTLYIQNY